VVLMSFRQGPAILDSIVLSQRRKNGTPENV
jgi:hypothetical protein